MADQHNAVHAFAEAVDAFRDWVDGPLDEGERDLHRLRPLLANLHSLVLRLPDDFDSKAPDPSGHAHNDWQELHSKLQRLPFNYYREFFDPFNDDEPVMGSLADDLADIYLDLSAGHELFTSGNLIGASWQWRLLFQTHWGEHLTGAQRAIHSWLTLIEGQLLPQDGPLT